MSVDEHGSGLDPVPCDQPVEGGRDTSTAPTRRGDRLAALGEITLCSGFPTQVGLVLLLSLVGAAPTDDTGQLSLSYVVVLSVVDAALILSLVWLLLRAHDERPVATIVGTGPIGPDILLGMALVPVALVLVAVSFALISRLAPSLHNVPENPLEALIRTPAAAIAFAVVSVVAGGLREEVQRAFILHRFEQHLGGAVTGLVVFSLAFGLGHLVQGRDAAIVTGLLGALWGILYLMRRSVVAPLVCHSIFNLTEVFIAYAGRE